VAAIDIQSQSTFFFYEFPFSGLETVESLSLCCFNMGDCRSESTKADQCKTTWQAYPSQRLTILKTTYPLETGSIHG
jgi:hypothetical protein